MKHIVFLLVQCLFMVAASAQKSPVLPWPKEFSKIIVAQEMRVQGMPMQVFAYVTRLSVDRVIAVMKENYGNDLVLSPMPGKMVLGKKWQNTHYLTITVEAGRASGKVSGYVSLSDMGYDEKKQATLNAYVKDWLKRLPAGSKVLSQYSSIDGVHESFYMTISNAASMGENKVAIIDALKHAGYVSENDDEFDEKSMNALSRRYSGGVLYFKPSKRFSDIFSENKRKSAMATISQANSGGTSVVLNIITTSVGE
jgi:hypothetical protein